MAGLLASILVEVEKIYRHFVSTRFASSKHQAGKLKFFSTLLNKLRTDVEEFALVIAPSKNYTTDAAVEIIEKVFILHKKLLKELLTKIN